MRFGKAEWSTWERGIEREWLLTNGIGGFASSTITGGNSRRYHGLLVAALKPPVGRHLILSQLHETVRSGGQSSDLHTFLAGDFVMKGFQHLEHFELDPLPVYSYRIGDILIEKTVTLIYGENTVAVVYRVRSGAQPMMLRITPLVNFRDYHGDSNRQYMTFKQFPSESSTRIRAYDVDPEILLQCRGSVYSPATECWFEGMSYPAERERGLIDREDHYIPGSFEISVEAYSDRAFTFLATIEADRVNAGGAGTDGYAQDGVALIQKECERLKTLEDQSGFKESYLRTLARAADHFIAYRQSTGAKTILAGYPWFSDWGRDAMISLPGLTLATHRYEDAAQILGTFTDYIRYGLIPNMFPDEGGDPGYNTVDAALWYFNAVHQYWLHTNDSELVGTKFLPAMEQIYQAFREGTLHHIHMEGDGLISAGDEHTQLTWMDAKVDGTVFTPRHGKPVEINALWYHALRILETLSAYFGKMPDEYARLADRVKRSFQETFWNEEQSCLYDVVRDGFRDGSVRPNQILAVSLDYPVMEGVKARSIVEKVWRELYTAYGLRSLSKGSAEYKGRCTGDRWARDSAYHQGTVWGWLIGPFVTAFSRTFGLEEQYSDLPSAFLEAFRDHLFHTCLGSISEIFDGDEPLTPRGCFAQAWSVAEVLRAASELRSAAGMSTDASGRV